MIGELFDVRLVTDQLAPDGKFKGKWSGYKVTFNAFGAEYEAKTKTGIRGIADCMVTVSDGVCSVET